MDYFVEVVKSFMPNEILLSPYFIVFIFVILALYSFNKKHGYKKIILVYLITFLSVLLNITNPTFILLIDLLAFFIALELLCDDSRKLYLFSLKSRIIDLLFILFFEYHFLTFALSIIMLSIDNEVFLSALAIKVISGLLFFVSILSVSRQKFMTKSVSDIACILEKLPITGCNIDKMDEKYHMLVAFEDKTFFDRSTKSHSLFSPNIAKNILKYINCRYIFHPINSIRRVFGRGYGTIEMQLARTLGVENGYHNCLIRRKIYEVLYSNLIFNSYTKTIRGSDKDNIKYWILNNYIKNVPAKVGDVIVFPRADKASYELIFHKNAITLSLEEFFVWCIHIEFIPLIGPNTLSKKESIIMGYNLNKSRIRKAIRVAKNNVRIV